MKHSLRNPIWLLTFAVAVIVCTPSLALAFQPQRGMDYGQRPSSAAERNGYEDGLRYGQHDRNVNKPSRPTDSQAYNDANRGYNSRFGSRDRYKVEYRRGYVNGYEQGYRGNYRDNMNRDRRDNNDRNRNDMRGNRNGPVGNAAERRGYEDGLRYGQHDRNVNKPFRPTDSQAYNDANSGYNSRFGDRDRYKVDYRQGYVKGYEQGYRGNYRR